MNGSRLLASITLLALLIPPLGAAKAESPGARRARPVVRVGSELGYPPFALGEVGSTPSGFTAELWNAVALEAGLDTRYQVAPFQDLLTSFRHGDLDVLINLAHSEERRSFAAFSAPHVTMYGAVFVRKGDHRIRSSADLRGRSILVLAGDLAHDWAIAQGWEKQLVPVAVTADGMRRLAAGEADAMLIGKLVGLQTLADEEITNVEPVGPPLDGFVQRFCFAVRRDDPELLARIDDALAVVRANGTFDHLYARWFGALEPSLLASPATRRYLVAGGLVTALVALAYLRERRLRHRLAVSSSLRDAMLESTADGILVVDRSTRIAFANQQFLRLWRIPSTLLELRDDLKVLEHVLDQVPDPAAFRTRVEELYARPGDESFDIIRFKDGRIFERYSKPQTLHGRIVGRVWSFRDVTARAVAEEQARSLAASLEAQVASRTAALTAANESLSESRERFREIAETIDEVFWVAAPRRERMIYASPAYERVWGRSVASLYQNPASLLDAIHPDDRAAAAARLGVGSEAGPWDAEYRVVRPDGSERWVWDRGFPVLSPSTGAPSHFVGVALDVTERRRLVDESSLHGRQSRLLVEIGECLIEDQPLAVVLDRCAAAMVHHLDAAFARVWVLDHQRRELVLTASAGLYTHLDGRHARLPLTSPYKIGAIATHRRPHLSHDLQHDPEIADPAWAEREGLVAFAGYPLIVESEVEGVLAMFSRRPIPDSTVATVEAAARAIGIGVARQRAEEALRQLNEDLERRVAERTADLAAANTALRHSQALFEQFMKHSPAIAFLKDASGRFTYVNDAFLAQFWPAGATPAWQGRSERELWPGRSEADLAATRARDEEVLHTGRAATAEERFTVPEGERTWLACRFPVPVPGGETLLACMAIDVTERKRLEEQFLQSQKMEAIGRLAGGVAHDFNNLLTVILAGSAFALQHLSATDPARADLAQVQDAAHKAASVTRQLLTFSRKEPSEAKEVGLRGLIEGFARLLARVVRENVVLELDLPSGELTVVAAPNQLEQVLLNLVVNACDAMPKGGAVTIRLREVTIQPDLSPTATATGAGVRRGAAIAVQDTGIGMNAETLRRSFEPFFTTKPVGQGTGLGLATAYGIVREAGGHMWAESQPGKGSTFHLVLPVSESTEPAAAAPAPAPDATGQETILVAEDDPFVRMVTVRMLRNLGYAVLEAALGGDAVELADHHPGDIHLLLTDVVMPDMSGPEVAKRVAALRPGIAVLFVSGYPDHPALDVNTDDIQRSFLAKPFTAEVLGRRVRQLLHRGAVAGA